MPLRKTSVRSHQRRKPRQIQVTKVKAYVRMERVASARGQHQAYLGERRGKQQRLKQQTDFQTIEIESELLDRTTRCDCGGTNDHYSRTIGGKPSGGFSLCRSCGKTQEES
jgi:hypothetical protein